MINNPLDQYHIPQFQALTFQLMLWRNLTNTAPDILQRYYSVLAAARNGSNTARHTIGLIDSIGYNALRQNPNMITWVTPADTHYLFTQFTNDDQIALLTLGLYGAPANWYTTTTKASVITGYTTAYIREMIQSGKLPLSIDIGRGYLVPLPIVRSYIKATPTA